MSAWALVYYTRTPPVRSRIPRRITLASHSLECMIMLPEDILRAYSYRDIAESIFTALNTEDYSILAWRSMAPGDAVCFTRFNARINIDKILVCAPVGWEDGEGAEIPGTVVLWQVYRWSRLFNIVREWFIRDPVVVAVGLLRRRGLRPESLDAEDSYLLLFPELGYHARHICVRILADGRKVLSVAVPENEIEYDAREYAERLIEAIVRLSEGLERYE